MPITNNIDFFNDLNYKSLVEIWPSLPVDPNSPRPLPFPINDRLPIKVGEFSLKPSFEKRTIVKNLYNPLKIESLLNQINNHLELCLSFDNKISIIDEKIILTAMDLNYKKNIVETEIELQENNENIINERASLLYNQSKVLQQDGVIVSDPVSINWAKKILLHDDALKSRKLKIEKDNIDMLIHRMNSEGDPLNLVERRERIKLLYDNEFEQMYKKFYAVSLGLKASFNIKLELPVGDSSDSLHRIRVHLNDVLEEVEQTLRYDHEFTITIPINSIGITRKDKESIRTTLSDDCSLNSIKEFSINSDVFIGKSNIRLRGYRLFARAEDQNDEDYGDFVHVEVDIPNQVITDDFVIVNDRSIVEMELTKLPRQSSGGWNTDVLNFNPIGQWRLSLPAKSAQGKAYNIKLIFIELLVAGTSI